MPDGELHPPICFRWYGGYVADCDCMLPHEGGFISCPPEARRPLPKLSAEQLAECERMAARIDAAKPKLKPTAPTSLSGDICHTCGSPNMVRTGTCLTCQSCGDSSGGCS